MDTTQGFVVGGDEPTPAGPFQEHLPCSFAGEQSGTGLLQASCLLQGTGRWGDVCSQAARESGAVVSGVHCYSPTTASAHRGKIAPLLHCHQLSHMQPAAGDKVRDHYHIVGSCRGAAQSRCDLVYRISKSEWNLPVVIHNLKGYDGHLTVKALKSEFGEVRVIPQNMGKYLSITHLSKPGQSREDPRS